MNRDILFITGVSSGIGLACARFFLDQGYKVYGIGRNNSITHENYQFLPLDLSDNEAISRFRFPDKDGEKYILINNAGVIGEICPFWEADLSNMQQVIQVNFVALTELTQRFIQSVPSGIILNISSGAGQRPVKGWSAYCASKAAVNLFSETLADEFEHYNQPFTIKSVAPGVVDTNMQTTIRKATKNKFPDRADFHHLYESQQLDAPEVTAQKLYYLLTHLDTYPATLLSLRSIELY